MTIKQILYWADGHYDHTGRWPTRKSGGLFEAPQHTWKSIDAALYRGGGGLAPGQTLAWVLHKHRGVRGSRNGVPLIETAILKWADRHQRRTGSYPLSTSGRAVGARGMLWQQIDQALRRGLHGLPGTSSLARLLTKHRGVRNMAELPPLRESQILEWADTHRENTGQWPHHMAGFVIGEPEENWRNIDNALRYGLRGFPGGSSVARLLAARRGRRNIRALPRLTREKILGWADAHNRRSGRYPNSRSGAIPDAEAPQDTWQRVDNALAHGRRGLAGGSSVAKLLSQAGRRRHLHRQPRLTVRQILKWADDHHKRFGRWPQARPERPREALTASGDKWRNIDNALVYGLRGLRGGSSLRQILQRYRRRAKPR